MCGSRLHRQDGFVREVLWLFLVIAVVATVLLDGMALFGAHQAVADDATAAANEARNQYTQTVNTTMAKVAAEEYLAKSGDTLLKFSATHGLDGSTQFEVKVKKHADTRVFTLLRFVGLKSWVAQMTNPVAVRTSD
jgi:hypothetical protein